MFFKNTLENTPDLKEQQLKKKVDKKSLANCNKYLYTDQINLELDSDELIELYSVSHDFCVESVKQKVSHYILNYLNIDSVFFYVKEAHTFPRRQIH